MYIFINVSINVSNKFELLNWYKNVLKEQQTTITLYISQEVLGDHLRQY